MAAFRRFGDGGSLMSALTYRLNPRILLTCFCATALVLTAWTLYITGTVHEVAGLVTSPFYGTPGQGSTDGLGNPPGDVTGGAKSGEDVLMGDWDKSGKGSTTGGAASDKKQRIVALVFYGRKETVEILDCYLKRNLRENGGMLDEVIFSVKTDKSHDLQYLDELVPTSKHYRREGPSTKYDSYTGSWEPANDPDTIYIKIDDDVVFIEDGTIAALVDRLEKNPQYFAVSANVVNNPALMWVHYSMGLYEPFWPELEKPTGQVSTSWKPSTLPSYAGPREGPEGFPADGSAAAPYQNHRWLPVRTKPGEKPYDITLTPASTVTFDAFGPSLHNWAAAAQTHYSFLTHLERNELHRYRFDVWDYQYQRLSINFYAIRGKDILDVFPFPQRDDEDYLTTKRPKEVGRHVVVDGSGVAVHYAFNPQYNAHEGHGVTWTDALSRYKGYADEYVCGAKHLKSAHSVESPVRSAKLRR